MYRFLFFVLLLIPNYSFSQYREYQEGDLMHVNNLTFKVSYALDKIMHLTNVTNHLENQWVSWADGDPISEEKYDALRLGAIDENSVREAIRNTFTEAEYTLLAAGKDHIEAFLTLSSEGNFRIITFRQSLSTHTEPHASTICRFGNQSEKVCIYYDHSGYGETQFLESVFGARF